MVEIGQRRRRTLIFARIWARLGLDGGEECAVVRLRRRHPELHVATGEEILRRVMQYRQTRRAGYDAGGCGGGE